MEIVIIAAVAPDNSIGRGGDLLYHISEDLKRFKSLTMGYPIIMGRKTFESFPKGALPGRRNIVVSRNKEYMAPGIEIAPSLEDALALCSSNEKAFIIGGGQIYNQAIRHANKLELTRILTPTRAEADTYFPEIGAEWKVVEKSPVFHDHKSDVDYRFETLIKA